MFLFFKNTRVCRFPNLPAIVHAVLENVTNSRGVGTRRRTVKRYFPMEMLSIVEGQRVPFDRIGKKPVGLFASLSFFMASHLL